MKIVRLSALLISSVAILAGLSARSDELPWSQRAATSAMTRWPDGRFVPAGQRWAWNYELGTLLEGMDAVWLNTTDPPLLSSTSKARSTRYSRRTAPSPRWKLDEYQLDNILLGRQLLFLYRVTRKPALSDRGHAALRPVAAPAAQRRRRLLAQAALSEPDVARRPLHGRAVLRRIRGHIASARGSSPTSRTSLC